MTDRKLMQQALELTYHPCTSILIGGLKKLKAWDVLAEWDKAREIVDKRLLTPLEQPEQEAQTATYTCGVCGVSMQMEQPEQEPVAKDWRHVIPGRRHTDPWDSVRLADYNQGWNDCQKKTKTELEKLYTTPPQREPLTDEECDDLWDQQTIHITDKFSARNFIRDVEAAHRIKGGA